MEVNGSLSHPDAKSIEGSLLCQEKERSVVARIHQPLREQGITRRQLQRFASCPLCRFLFQLRKPRFRLTKSADFWISVLPK